MKIKLFFRAMADDELTLDEARALLADYAARRRGRDLLIRRAVLAGLSVDEIADLLELGRATVYRALPRQRARRPAVAAAALPATAPVLPGNEVWARMPLFLPPPDLRKQE